MSWFNKHISAGDIIQWLTIVFFAGFFYASTQHTLENLSEKTAKIESRIEINRNDIQVLQTRQGRIDQRLESAIMRQDERYAKILDNIEYIRGRLDQQQN